MKRLLLFAGTSEGRVLAEALADQADLTVSVATDYGACLLAGLPASKVVEGRLEQAEMEQLMADSGCQLVVDATHPYAALASRNIAQAAAQRQCPLLRLARAGVGGAPGAIRVASIQAAASYLEEVQGNVLLTTGAKELEPFTRIPDYQRRLFVRVLPAVESLEKCMVLGIPQGHIAAMQGPFSTELNTALLHQWQIETLVTKDSGGPGGFAEKAAAAEAVNAGLVVVERPDAPAGLPYKKLLTTLRHWLEVAE